MLRSIKRIGITAVISLLCIVGAAAVYLFVYPAPLSANVLINAAFGRNLASLSPALVPAHLQAPAGFSVSLYASKLDMVRMLRFSAGGHLLATRPRQGEVVTMSRDGDSNRAAPYRVLLSGLNQPHGIDIADGWLYIGEADAIGRVRYDEVSGELRGTYERIVTGLGGEGNHWSKTVRIGPDGYLYLAQGSTCNVCEEKDKRRATMIRFKADGSEGEIFATGLRNSVGFDWAPWDSALYATDNGRDWLGDDFPPCELNRIERGGFYGWPYVNGFGVLDPDLGKGKEALLQTAISPAFAFRAHNAPLGIHFLRNARMPAGYERTALVALHGSWNRQIKDGYKVVALHWRDNGSIESSDFLVGFEKNSNVIGRPVDVTEGPDGALYISDDYAGAIYRVAYGEKPAATTAAAPARTPVPDTQLQAMQPVERAQKAAQGEALYAKHGCANCHGQNAARALRPVRELKDLATRYDLVRLQEFFKTPTPPMPVFPLSAEERQALAVYLLTSEQKK